MATSPLSQLPPEYRDALHSDTLTHPAFLINPDHPQADDYLQGIQHIKRAVVVTSSRMKPRDVQIVKKWHLGERIPDIAEAVGCAPGTASKALHAKDAQDLYQLLQHLAAAIDGPNEAERRAMLWRIARTAEDRAPKTAITAIAELNRMTIADYQRNSAIDGSNNQPTIVIMNQTVIPKGALDQ